MMSLKKAPKERDVRYKMRKIITIETILKTSEKDGMNDIVEGIKQVEENEWGDITTIPRNWMRLLGILQRV